MLPRGMQTPWVPGQPLHPADVEESFYLLVDSADHLHLAVLVDRPRDRDVLANGNAGQAGQQTVKLGKRGAVAVNPAVSTARKSGWPRVERVLAGVAIAQIALQDQHAFVVGAAGKLALALDVDDSLLADPGRGGDSPGPAEVDFTQVDHRQAVDLAHGFSCQRDPQRPLGNHLPHLRGNASAPFHAR